MVQWINVKMDRDTWGHIYAVHCNNRLQNISVKRITNNKYQITRSGREVPIFYPQMPAPAGVQRALDTLKVVVKEVEVEMEVVVIQ